MRDSGPAGTRMWNPIDRSIDLNHDTTFFPFLAKSCLAARIPMKL